MRHVISYRPLEGEERDQLATPPTAKTDEWGCALSILGSAAVLGCALGLVLQMFLQAVAHLRFLPLVTTALLLTVAWRVAGAIRRTRRETHVRLAQDRAEDAAEVVEVWEPLVVRQEDDPPAFLVDIGGGRLLVVQSAAVDDVPVLRMGRPWGTASATSRQEEGPPILSAHFTLHRGRRSGRILRVDVMGDPIPLHGIVPAGTIRADAPTRIIEASLPALLAKSPIPPP